jgi:hypothetical protein
MNTDLLGDQPVGCRLYETNHPHGSRDIYLPYSAPGGHRDPNLEYEIEVELRVREPLKFARRLNELQDYEIELQCCYEDMSRADHSSSLPIQGSFSDLRENIIQGWKQNKQHDLVLEARGI